MLDFLNALSVGLALFAVWQTRRVWVLCKPELHCSFMRWPVAYGGFVTFLISLISFWAVLFQEAETTLQKIGHMSSALLRIMFAIVVLVFTLSIKEAANDKLDEASI